MTKNNTFARLAAAGIASAALIATVACNGNGIDTVRAERDPRLLQTAANGSLGTAAVGNQQMLVNCGPYQRTLVRTTYLNGQPVASVDCVPAEDAAAVAAAAPAGYATQQFAPATAQRVVYTAAPAPGVVRTVAPARSTVTPRVYTERRAVRSKTKSAVIIGTTAAAGAGVGALIGGKKGALIGAVAGGGGAAIWDQVTRRKNQ